MGDDRLRAVCLLSGGMDSAVAAYIAQSQGYSIHALTFDYGQRHKREIGAAKNIAKALNAQEHKIFKLDLGEIGGSALTDNMEVPTRTDAEEIGDIIPPTYVPMRNTILLSVGAAYAEVIGADAMFIGANAVDYSNYPDCRPEYFTAMKDVMRLGSKRGVEGSTVEIMTPIISLSKAEIVKKGIELGVPFELTWSCYRGGEKACGRCDACVLRLKGFYEAGFDDPLKYEEAQL